MESILWNYIKYGCATQGSRNMGGAIASPKYHYRGLDNYTIVQQMAT